MSEPLGQSPFGAFYFTVEIFGESMAYPFRSCSGLRTESTVIELKEGGRDQPHKLVGEVKTSNLVLKRGFCSATSELYKMPAGKPRIPRSGGSPLDGGTRAKMEQQLGAKLDGAKVNTSGESATAAEQLGARAFSTSYGAEPFGGRIQFVIEAKHAKKIDFMSLYPEQKEALIAPGAHFRVLERVNAGDKIYIRMENYDDRARHAERRASQDNRARLADAGGPEEAASGKTPVSHRH